MVKLKRIEKENSISLPEVYKEFYRLCCRGIPANLVGTDLVNNCYTLNKWAQELLEEDGVGALLAKDDFVFMMHQGYVFWYFKAAGESDPIVYCYYEGKQKPEILGRFSEFIQGYTQ